MAWVKILENFIREEQEKNCKTDYLWKEHIFVRGFLTQDQNSGYHIMRVKILGCATKPFQGAHYVQIEDTEPFWVHSLTALRKNFLHYKDFVSFERSAFFALNWFGNDHAGPSVLLRLKLIRHLFDIEVIPIDSGTKIYKSPQGFYHYKKTVKPLRVKLTERTKSQVDRILRCMINNLDQEFKDRQITKNYIRLCIDKM